MMRTLDPITTRLSLAGAARIAAIATLVVLAAACYTSGRDWDAPPVTREIGDTVVVDGVSVTLESVTYAPLTTELSFRAVVERLDPEERGDLTIGQVSVDGPIVEQRPLFRMDPQHDGSTRITATLGRITDTTKEIEVVVEYLVNLGWRTLDELSGFEGPWRFTFVPEPPDADEA